jgi:N-acetylmuramoyl-L-alanine amidase
MTEEELNLIVGLKLRDALTELGATVIMTREVSEITISGIERCTIPNEAGCDVCVRIHANYSPSVSASGVSMMVPYGELLMCPEIVDESVRLGELMLDIVSEATGAKKRDVVPRSDLIGFNWSEIPTVLIEMGFMSNPEEDALLETEEYQNKIVDGMVASLIEWYGAE